MMTKARLYEFPYTQPTQGYASELLAVIDAYIQKRQSEKPHGLGMDRARQLRACVAIKLRKVEGLTEAQLMWRMYDYLCKLRHAYPFGSSKRLRSSVLEHLCHYLKITNDMLTVIEAQLSKKQLHGANGMPFVAKLFQANREMLSDEARRYMISAALRLNYPKDNQPILCPVMDKLEAILQEAEAPSIINHIKEQWLGWEKLSEHQLLCRLSEHIDVSVQSGQGLFNGDLALCQKVASIMTEYLQIDESRLRRLMVNQAQGLYIKLSSLGPIYQKQHDDRMAIGILLAEINEALRVRVPGNFIAAPFAPGEAIELTQICRK